MHSLFMLPIITPVITSNTTQFENSWSQIVDMRSTFNFHRPNKKIKLCPVCGKHFNSF